MALPNGDDPKAAGLAAAETDDDPPNRLGGDTDDNDVLIALAPKILAVVLVVGTVLAL